MAFDAYRCYLSLKNHFTKDQYDYHKYRGKTRATKQAFYKRKDRFWFEKFARQKKDKEVEEFFVSNFIYSTDPGKMWIGEMIKEGEERYQQWQKKVQSLSYVFKDWDKKLNDPVWETVSLKIKKYSPFLNIDVPRYKKILKEVVL